METVGEFGRMRTILLATVAGVGVTAGAGWAQNAAPPAFAPTQGQVAWPLTSKSIGTANDNNNAQANAIPGPFENPTPGTIVVHINGRVHAGFATSWSSADQRFFTAPAGSPGGPTLAAGAAPPLATVLGNNGTGVAKLQPESLYSYARLYFGADAMATNGLRYGAAIEIRQNFTGLQSSTSSDGASAYTSLQTLFVRRAFTYVAGDQWGILRVGQADGIIGLYDNGVTTFQFLPTGNLQNGSDLAMLAPSNNTVPFFFLSLDGNEYAYNKVVYLSPQVAGFNFAVQYSPTIANGFGLSSSAGGLSSSLTGSGNGTGVTCSTATSGCPTLSSGPGIADGARVLNHTVVGARYQGTMSGVGLLAYAAYGLSGHADYTGATTASVLGNTVAGSKFTGKYDGLSYGSGGIALTYAGITIGGNMIGGRIDGTLAPSPQNGTSEIGLLVGAKYIVGPFTIGVSAERAYYQGNVNLTGISQRRGQALDAGASYAVAPGYTVYVEYQYQNLNQSAFNFITGGIGSAANNSIDSQGFVIGNVVNF
jgi:predicted porin